MGPLDTSLNDMATGEGFLIVSTAEQPLPGVLRLRTTDGSTAEVTLRPAPGSAGTLIITPSTLHVTGEPGTAQVVAGSGSANRNDTTIEVLAGDAVVARFELTTLANPRVRFRGRFQCRLATDANRFDEPWGNDGSFFRLYAVPGEDPDNPAASAPEPPLDRIIRFQDPVALRPLCGSIGVVVSAIEAEVGSSRVEFAGGDPLLGLPVRLGPQSRFEEQNGVFADVGWEPIADFRLEIGTLFAGASAPAVERHNVQPGDPPPSTAPYADFIFTLDAVGPWKPADFGYEAPTWAAHAQQLIPGKLQKLLDNEPAEPPGSPAHRIWAHRVAIHQQVPSNLVRPLTAVQRFTGAIDREQAFPAEPRGMLAYLRTLPAIPFYAEFFDFDTDCQCGTVTGTLGVLPPPAPVPEGARLTPTEARGAPALPEPLVP